ncbi:MAG TPA: CopG family transcriptional regulator [candidate division Zixibacteria bacterium]|nr:CopG family transcriptional regulator [candidate division Zixibacteria bacterium]
MKRKTKYSDEPIGDIKVVEDFLPAPDQLVLKKEKIKVTIVLNKSSVEFFKEVAKEKNISYQKMIRKVIDWYADHYKESA